MTETTGGRAFVFPGQGSQKIGMGRSWTGEGVAARTFEEADEALGMPLSRLCWEGPEEELQLTANQQPAILTASVAQARVLAERGHRPDVVAGHSLGEYSALVVAEALAFHDAVRIVRRRGELMQEAVPVGLGGMAAILGLDVEVVEEIVAEAAAGDICEVANLNAPGQIVVAGHARAIDRAIELARSRGARRAISLPVSAPFHSSLMAPAREGLTPLLQATSFDDPVVPVVCNVDARPMGSGAEARDALVRQVDSPVRWIESVRWMVDEMGVDRFVEVGPGAVLSGLVRRIVPGQRPTVLGGPDDLERLDG